MIRFAIIASALAIALTAGFAWLVIRDVYAGPGSMVRR